MAKHIIHKQKVLLRIPSEIDAFTFQNRVSRLLKGELLPVIESTFNNISPNGDILRIDKLSVDLGSINGICLEKEFSEKLIEKLSEALSNAAIGKGNDNISQIRKEQSLIDSLLFFLEHGYMPWYSTVGDFSAWEEEITGSFSNKEWKLLVKWLKKHATGDNFPIQRLTWQFSESFLQTLLIHIHEGLQKNRESVHPDFHIILKELRKDLTEDESLQHHFWKEVITTALLTENEKDYISELLTNIRSEFQMIRSKKEAESKKSASNVNPEKDAEIEPLKKKKESKRNTKPVEDELFTENCGVVILTPFLQMYFEELGLLDKLHFKNDTAQKRAVLLLHYLATAETTVAEMNLLLPKLLCALNFEEPVPNKIDLSEKEKEESETLLKSVLGHWEPLRRTSIEGLRQTFFQREGRLTPTETGWKLRVEQKTVDILLDKLPWGYSTIKLPWMKNILNVEWC